MGEDHPLAGLNPAVHTQPHRFQGGLLVGAAGRTCRHHDAVLHIGLGSDIDACLLRGLQHRERPDEYLLLEAYVFRGGHFCGGVEEAHLRRGCVDGARRPIVLGRLALGHDGRGPAASHRQQDRGAKANG